MRQFPRHNGTANTSVERPEPSPEEKEHKGFFQVSSKVYNRKDLTGIERAVFTALCHHADNTTTECNPSIDRIARFAGTSRHPVIDAIAKLESLNIITVTRTHGCLNQYKLNDHRSPFAPPKEQEDAP